MIRIRDLEVDQMPRMPVLGYLELEPCEVIAGTKCSLDQENNLGHIANHLHVHFSHVMLQLETKSSSVALIPSARP